jgi:hypothetical protein
MSIFSNSSHLEWRVRLSDDPPRDHPCQVWFSVKFFFQPIYTDYGSLSNCLRQPHPPFKMAAVAKNRNFFNCPLRRVRLSDTNLKGAHPGTIPARFGLIWFSSFRGEDLNVIFYQNMPNLHNRYKSAERKISQKNPKQVLIYSLPCSCS